MRHTLLIVCLLLRAKAQLQFEDPPPGGATKTIAEGAKSGTILYALQARDPSGNMPFFSIASSRCESTPRPSSIPTFTINSLDQLVVPEDRLDAESCTKFRFTFIATAGGSTVTSDNLTVIVTDVNDNPPHFIRPPFHGDVWKNDKAGKIVNENNTISATDPDISNKSITLTISGAQGTFAISDNGSVYVNDKSGLAALASPTVLTIQASDGGLTSTATLEIIVHDDPCSSSPCQNGGSCTSLKDHFTCSCLSGYMGIHCENVNYCFANYCQNNGTCETRPFGYNCSCAENYISSTTNCTHLLRCRERTLTMNETNHNTSIGSFQNDYKMYLPDYIDANLTTNLSAFLINREISDRRNLQDIFNGTHIILPNGIDRETLANLLLEFNVTFEQASIICNVTLIINDINDNAPIFTKNASDIEVCPTVKNGSVLFNVKATDADATEQYNHVSYILRGSDRFTIDSQGKVSTTGSLKDEPGSINLTIIATDGQYSTPTQSTIQVQKPQCKNNNTTINETTQPIAIPVNLFDEGGSGMYSAENCDIPIGLLHVSSVYTFNGTHLSMLDGKEITINFNGTHINLPNGIDRETFANLPLEFNLDVVSMKCPFILTINDINDNLPVFNQSRYEVCSLTDIRTGTKLGTVKATDADATPQFNTITYSLENPEDSDYFQIDKTSGVITSAKLLDQPRNFHMKVKASSGELEGSAELWINVYNGNCSSADHYNHCQTDYQSGCLCGPSSVNKFCTTKESPTPATEPKPSEKPTEKDEQNDGETNMIIALLVAGLCAIIIVVAFVCCFFQYKATGITQHIVRTRQQDHQHNHQKERQTTAI